MTSFQKVIKYVALALAIFLVVTIFSGIITALSSVSFLFSKNATDAIGEMKSYEINSEISSLSISLSGAQLKIQTADKFSVESNHKYISIKEDNGTLKISETKEVFSVFNEGVTVILSVPKDFVFDHAKIEAGAGTIDIETLSCNVLDITLGAGKTDIKNLTANSTSRIDGGAGEVNIANGKLCNLDLDMGAGKLSLKSRIEGKSDIEYGVGETKIILIGNIDDYKIELDKGLGDAKLSGENMSDGSVYGSGENYIEIDGGVGALYIDFAA